MTTYSVTVRRIQEWHITVQASDELTAKQIADAAANDEPAHDDFAYETVARIAKMQEPDSNFVDGLKQ